jgi:crotonobetainyl-CoA:carnitine CoA-transferase CaiB-like acyl-CoA transferase
MADTPDGYCLPPPDLPLTSSSLPSSPGGEVSPYAACSPRAVGALELRFPATLLAGLGLADVPDRDDPLNWAELCALLAGRFAQRTREEWIAVFAGGEACVEPVLSITEAAADRRPRCTAPLMALSTSGRFSVISATPSAVRGGAAGAR